MSSVNKNFLAVAAGIALSISLIEVSPVQAASFSFVQRGWAYGGELFGSFIGDDFNGDGELEPNELSSFNVTFSGNILVNSFPPGNPVTPFVVLSYPGERLNLLKLFNYSLSTSELVFSAVSCGFGEQPLSCSGLSSITSISASSQGGSVSLSPPPRLGGPVLTTSSSLGVVVTPLQKQVPEPSTVATCLLGSLVFLLRKKVVPSRMIKETTKKR
ncbi:MAG: hypothetical protein ICV54_01395 [Nostoc sp. C3-bin3]|nr:hypothetical protein [Nostoc sp. C3-bin3]